MEPPKKLIKLNETQPQSPNAPNDPEISQIFLELPANFQPTGISYNQGDKKTILIITGVNEILTFLLGDLKTILSSSGIVEPFKKNVIEISSSVIKVMHSKLKTYCLHEDGSVSLFTSYKQLKKLRKPLGCHDIMRFKDGVALLVKEPNKNLTIEYLPDTSVPESIPKIIDCGPSVDNEQCSLGSVVVTEQNSTFLSKFLGFNLDSRTLLMFSVGSNIFWVNDGPDVTDDYEIRIVRSYSSKVTRFWLTNGFFVAVLVSGVMEVSYLCPVLTLISCKRFYLYDKCWSFNIEKTCVFSDGLNLNMIVLEKGKNEVKLVRKSVQLPGVVGIIHVKEVNRMLCVTENRGLYQVSVKIEKISKEMLENRQFLQVFID